MTRRRTEARLQSELAAGTIEHYRDATLYDHEYRRRRFDVTWYRTLARDVLNRAVGDERAILELGCGTGRLLGPLARDGHRIVGVDSSSPMLARCAERIGGLPAAARGRATLHHGDFRTCRLDRRFALILCAFNGFMHLYERADVERLLAVVRAHLAPGGLFAFDVMNPDLKWLMRDPNRRWARTRFRHPQTGRWMVYSTNQFYDAALQIAFMRIFYEEEGAPGKPERMVRLAHRQFFPSELEELLHYNGLILEQREGDFSGQPFTSESDLQVCRCRVAPTEFPSFSDGEQGRRRPPTAKRRGASHSPSRKKHRPVEKN